MISDSASLGSNPSPPASVSPSELNAFSSSDELSKREQNRNIAWIPEAQKSAQSAEASSGTVRPTWRTPIALYRGRPNPKRDGVAIDAWTAERFESHVDSSGGPEACWPWQGGRSGFGYGRFKVAGKLISPHRVAYVLKHGKLVPDGSYHGGMVMHSCDNPICCNPKHLTLGTAKQNAQDMARKKRAYPQSQAFRARHAEVRP